MVFDGVGTGSTLVTFQGVEASCWKIELDYFTNMCRQLFCNNRALHYFLDKITTASFSEPQNIRFALYKI